MQLILKALSPVSKSTCQSPANCSSPKDRSHCAFLLCDFVDFKDQQEHSDITNWPHAHCWHIMLCVWRHQQATEKSVGTLTDSWGHCNTWPKSSRGQVLMLSIQQALTCTHIHKQNKDNKLQWNKTQRRISSVWAVHSKTWISLCPAP